MVNFPNKIDSMSYRDGGNTKLLMHFIKKYYVSFTLQIHCK